MVQRMLRQSHVDITMRYLHHSRKARNAQGRLIERILPDGSTLGDGEERSADERVRAPRGELAGNAQVQ
jgi:hypothetical protein